MLEYQFECVSCLFTCNVTLDELVNKTGMPVCRGHGCSHHGNPLVLMGLSLSDNNLKVRHALDRVLDLSVACLDMRKVARMMYKFDTAETDKDQEAIRVVQKIMQSIPEK